MSLLIDLIGTLCLCLLFSCANSKTSSPNTLEKGSIVAKTSLQDFNKAFNNAASIPDLADATKIAFRLYAETVANPNNALSQTSAKLDAIDAESIAEFLESEDLAATVAIVKDSQPVSASLTDTGDGVAGIVFGVGVALGLAYYHKIKTTTLKIEGKAMFEVDGGKFFGVPVDPEQTIFRVVGVGGKTFAKSEIGDRKFVYWDKESNRYLSSATEIADFKSKDLDLRVEKMNATGKLEPMYFIQKNNFTSPDIDTPIITKSITGPTMIEIDSSKLPADTRTSLTALGHSPSEKIYLHTTGAGFKDPGVIKVGTKSYFSGASLGALETSEGIIKYDDDTSRFYMDVDNQKVVVETPTRTDPNPKFSLANIIDPKPLNWVFKEIYMTIDDGRLAPIEKNVDLSGTKLSETKFKGLTNSSIYIDPDTRAVVDSGGNHMIPNGQVENSWQRAPNPIAPVKGSKLQPARYKTMAQRFRQGGRNFLALFIGTAGTMVVSSIAFLSESSSTPERRLMERCQQIYLKMQNIQEAKES